MSIAGGGESKPLCFICSIRPSLSFSRYLGSQQLGHLYIVYLTIRITIHTLLDRELSLQLKSLSLSSKLSLDGRLHRG